MLQDYAERIENSRVYSAANETPLQAVSILSRRLANRVFLKREDLQPVFSFKLRGAYNKMAGIQVPDGEPEQFHAFLSELNYPFHEETGNSAYELFLESDR